MISPAKVKFELALCVVFCVVLVRLAIGLELVSSQDVLTAIKRLALLAISVIIFRFARKSIAYSRTINKIPGPSLLLNLRVLMNLMFTDRQRASPVPVRALEVLQSISKVGFDGDDGHMYAVSSFVQSAVFVTSADAVKEVLNHPHTQSKGYIYSLMEHLGGRGLLTLNGEEWKYHRKIMTPAFHFKILESLMSIAAGEAELMISKLEREASGKIDRSIDNIIPHVFDSISNVLLKSAMGIESADESNITIIKNGLSEFSSVCLSFVMNPLLLLAYLLGLTEKGRNFNKFRAALASFVDDVISRRKDVQRSKTTDNNNETDDKIFSLRKEREPFIDILVREHMRSPETFSIDDIRGNTVTITLAAIDTTNWSTSYTLLFLGLYPEVQEKLYQEVQEFFEHSDLDQLTIEQISKFTYLNAVFNESLRLIPPAPGMTRKADADISIKGRVIPKGTEIVLFMHHVHHDERYWPDPYRFKPERFLTGSPQPHTFLPFSTGNRNCIGQKYALILAKTIIVNIVRTYRIQSITQLDEIPTYLFPVAHTETPIKLRLDKRATVDTRK